MALSGGNISVSTSVSASIKWLRSPDFELNLFPFFRLSLNKLFFQAWWCSTSSALLPMLSPVKKFLVIVESGSPEPYYGGVIMSARIYFLGNRSPFPARLRQRRTTGRRSIALEKHHNYGAVHESLTLTVHRSLYIRINYLMKQCFP